jgi:hypothetical protein
LVQFLCDGTIQLTNTITVSLPTILDANGHNVVLSGGGAFRLFSVDPGVSLTLTNLTIANGLAQGANGAAGLDGAEADGGAILVNGGTLNLLGCRIWTNSAVGGAGGDSTGTGSYLNGSGGPALGGAIYVIGGTINATNSEFAGNVVEGGAGGANYYVMPSGSGGNSSGGSIYAYNSALNLANCSFLVNTATGGPPPQGLDSGVPGMALGGALFNNGGTTIVASCTFRLNEGTVSPPLNITGGYGAAARGGAAYNAAGTISIHDTRFLDNRAAGGDARRSLGTAGPGEGGAICNMDILNIEGCLFQNNSANGGNNGIPAGDGQGGAIFNGGQLSIAQTEFAQNMAQAGQGYYGGQANVVSGIAYGGAIFNTNLLKLIDSTCYGNGASGAAGGYHSSGPFPGSAAFGGGIYNAGGCYLTNNTFAANSVSGGSCIVPQPPINSSYTAGGDACGGGLFQRAGTTYLLNNTFASNSANGGIGYPAGNSFGGGIARSNGVVWLANTILANGLSGSNGFGVLTDGGHNLSSDASCGFSATGGLNNVDPRLGPLDNYGGPNRTMPLLAGSPAIDGGDSSLFPPTDQRGRVRPYGSAPDIGAFESSPPYVIRGTVSGFTLREEIPVVAGSTTVFTTNGGHYSLEGVAAGTYSVGPVSTNYLFVPSSRSVTVGPDQLGADFAAYQWNTLSPDTAVTGMLHLVFAGTQGQTYWLLESTNLVGWLPVATNTVGPSNYFEVFVPINGDSHFFRTIVH